jgi:hypothetical protein
MPVTKLNTLDLAQFADAQLSQVAIRRRWPARGCHQGYSGAVEPVMQSSSANLERFSESSNNNPPRDDLVGYMSELRTGFFFIAVMFAECFEGTGEKWDRRLIGKWLSVSHWWCTSPQEPGGNEKDIILPSDEDERSESDTLDSLRALFEPARKVDVKNER